MTSPLLGAGELGLAFLETRLATGTIDPEMQRRFDAAERTRVSETNLRRDALRPSEESLRAHFTSAIGRAEMELENPHVEPRVSSAERARAVDASVLIAIVLREPEPTVVVTQRHH